MACRCLLEADLPADTVIDPNDMQDARQILENRSNGLGVSEVTFQVAGTNRIVGEFPGLENTEEVIAVLKETGQLEFVDTGDNFFNPGTEVVTDLNGQQLTQPTDLTGDSACCIPYSHHWSQPDRRICDPKPDR